jgi:hypothetical protein
LTYRIVLPILQAIGRSFHHRFLAKTLRPVV